MKPAPRRSRDATKPALRSVSLLVLFTENEHRTLRDAARRAGLGLGPWLRSLGMREARVPPTAAGEPMP